MTQIAAALERLDVESPHFLLELSNVMEAVAGLPEGERPFSLIFEFMEKHPHADLGAPGPIVHTLEKLGGYETCLAESLRRRPTPHTLWMVNRILNAELEPQDRDRWLGELRRVVSDPKVPVDVQGEALEFLQHQSRR